MKIILDIDNNALGIILKEGIINSENKIYNVWVASELMDALDNAVTLPDNATNGDIIKILFNETEYPKLIRLLTSSDSFWNAPYKGEQEG